MTVQFGTLCNNLSAWLKVRYSLYFRYFGGAQIAQAPATLEPPVPANSALDILWTGSRQRQDF